MATPIQPGEVWRGGLLIHDEEALKYGFPWTVTDLRSVGTSHPCGVMMITDSGTFPLLSHLLLIHVILRGGIPRTFLVQHKPIQSIPPYSFSVRYGTREKPNDLLESPAATGTPVGASVRQTPLSIGGREGGLEGRGLRSLPPAGGEHSSADPEASADTGRGKGRSLAAGAGPVAPPHDGRRRSGGAAARRLVRNWCAVVGAAAEDGLVRPPLGAAAVAAAAAAAAGGGRRRRGPALRALLVLRPADAAAGGYGARRRAGLPQRLGRGVLRLLVRPLHRLRPDVEGAGQRRQR